MATVSGRGRWIAKGAHITEWLAMGDADVGSAQSPSQLSDKSVQVDGTFAGGTIVLQGSNDGSTWTTLRDPAGVALSFTAAGLKQVLENTVYVRPSTSGGGGASINVRVVERSGALT